MAAGLVNPPSHVAVVLAVLWQICRLRRRRKEGGRGRGRLVPASVAWAAAAVLIVFE